MINPGVTITVSSDAILTIAGSHLYGCDEMWQGINVEPGGQVIITGTHDRSSFIEDAIVAINMDMLDSYTAYTEDLLSVDNTIFNRNYISISIKDYHVYYLSGVYPFHVKNTLFTCRDIPFTQGSISWNNLVTVKYSSAISTYPATPDVMADPFIEDANYAPFAYLKPPYNSSTPALGRSLTAINLEHLIDREEHTTEVVIGTDEGIDDGNFPTVIFDGHVIGIDNQDSRLTVYDCTFQKYLNDVNIGSFDQTGIYAHGGSEHCALHVINPDPGNIPNNAFFNMYYGIHCEGNEECVIQNSDFRSDMDITVWYGLFHPINYASSGIYAADNQNLTIENNRLYNIVDPIRIEFAANPAGANSIQYNTIGLYPAGLTTNPPNPVVVNAIQIRGSTTPPLSGNGGVIICSHNTLEPVSTGITVSNIGILEGEIKDNYIKLYEARRWDIFGPGWAPPYDGYGIQIEAVGTSIYSYNYVGENTVVGNMSDPLNQSTTDTAAIRVAQSFNMVVGCNTVSNCINGLNFLGSVTSTKVIKNTMYPTDQTGFTYPVGQSGFTLDQAGIIGVQIFDEVNSDNDWVEDNSNWAAFGGGTVISSMANAYNGSDPANSILYVRSAPNFNPDDPNNYADPLFSAYSTASGSIQVVTPIDITCAGVEARAGKANSTPSHQRGADTSAAEKIALGRVHIPLPDSASRLYVMQQQLCANLYRDTAFLNSSAILQSFMQVNANSSLAAINHIGAAIAQGDTATGATLLSNMVSANQVDDNYMLFFNWMLTNYSQIQSGNTVQLNTTDIYQLALKCPFTDGVVVYAARNLYNSLVKETVHFKNNCSGQEQSRQALTKKEHKANTTGSAIVYPNPTSTGEVTVAFQDKLISPKSIVVTDIYGKVILQKSVVNNQSPYTLKIKGAPGLYLLTITDETTRTRETKKIVLQ